MNERAFIALGSVNLLNMIFKPRVAIFEHVYTHYKQAV